MWHPDLGEPFGVMHCVQCLCEPVSLTSPSLCTSIYISRSLVCEKGSLLSDAPFSCYRLQQKSRRGKVFGKVNCKNIKQDCPDPNCDDPVLLPGHCCKTCPKGMTLSSTAPNCLLLDLNFWGMREEKRKASLLGRHNGPFLCFVSSLNRASLPL